LTVLNDIPFTIPPYFALLGRAIITLEGVALSGDPEYAIIRQSYPFVARKLLREGRPEIQKALQEVLYSKDSSGSTGLKMTRLLALLNNAAGEVATKDGAVFVDLDQIPENGLSFKDGLKFMLSENSEGLRSLLEKEVDTVVDVISRQVFRRAMTEAMIALAPPRLPSLPFLGDLLPPPPALDQIPLPILLPSTTSTGSLTPTSMGVLTLKELTETIAPKLTRDEEVYAIGLGEGAKEFFGNEIGDLIKGEKVLSPQTGRIVLQALRSGLLGRNELLNNESAKALLQFTERALNSFRGSNGSSSTSFENDLSTALASLDTREKGRFDDIMEQLTLRAIDRVVKRLSTVERIA
jgi:hypothetical protein